MSCTLISLAENAGTAVMSQVLNSYVDFPLPEIFTMTSITHPSFGCTNTTPLPSSNTKGFPSLWQKVKIYGGKNNKKKLKIKFKTRYIYYLDEFRFKNFLYNNVYIQGGVIGGGRGACAPIPQ